MPDGARERGRVVTTGLASASRRVVLFALSARPNVRWRLFWQPRTVLGQRQWPSLLARHTGRWARLRHTPPETPVEADLEFRVFAVSRPGGMSCPASRRAAPRSSGKLAQVVPVRRRRGRALSPTGCFCPSYVFAPAARPHCLDQRFPRRRPGRHKYQPGRRRSRSSRLPAQIYEDASTTIRGESGAMPSALLLGALVLPGAGVVLLVWAWIRVLFCQVGIERRAAAPPRAAAART